MDPLTVSAPPRPERYRGATGQNVSIEVTRDSGENVPVEIVDISLGGVKLEVPSAMRFQEPICLTFSDTDSGWRMSLPAVVRWARTTPQSSWNLGCAFREQLSPEGLEDLFQRGVVERRRFARFPVNRILSAKPELSEDRPVRAIARFLGRRLLHSERKPNT